MEQRVLYIERELNTLELKGEGVKECLAALEATDTRFRGLVLKIVHNLTTHLAQLDLFWQIISSLLLPGRSVSGGGVDPPMLLLNLRGNLDQGVPLPPVPPSSPSSPVGWIPPLSTPPLTLSGPIRQGHPQRRMTGSGPRCRPSRLQRLRMVAVWDFLEVEDQYGTWEVERQLGEEMEMYQIPVNYNVLGCQNCDLLVHPIEYCRESW